MTTHTTVQMMKTTSAVIMSLMTMFETASAFAQERKPVDPSGPFAKRVGQITQLKSSYDQPLAANEVTPLANAAIISPCRIITNYHVAFGKAKNTETKKVRLFTSRAIGHEVNFAFDLNAKTGAFNKTVKAKVVGFSNYAADNRGIRGDMAVLQLETCLDQKEYAQLDLEMAESQSTVPVGSLMTVSVETDANGKNQILVQEGCKSDPMSGINGLFVSNCEAVSGMSGSLVYEFGRDEKWHWTGLTTNRISNDGDQSGLIAINAKTIAAFFTQSFGEVPMAIAPMALDDRAPQSTQSAMANTNGKVTVQ